MKVSRLPASALGAALVAATSFAAPAPFSRSALDFVRDEIHVGINIGNTLDVPKGDEVEWGNVPVTRELIPAALSLALDSAADGLPNVGEWLADTDPHDAASRFSMRGIAPAATARTITLSWPSVEGRTYTVLRAERLGEPFLPYRAGVPATPPENVIDLPSDDSDTAFYRIAIDTP